MQMYLLPVYVHQMVLYCFLYQMEWSLQLYRIIRSQ